MLVTEAAELAIGLTPLQLGGEGPLTGELFLLGRLLFGGVFAYNGLNHFLDAESMVGYAGAKGVPAPGLMIPISGGVLLFGGLGIAAGVLPTLAAGALIGFLLVTTPVMHDFWAVPEEQQQGELINFLKNVAMTGAALALLAISTTAWPYALA
jgi:uncharacterized membrane protein YphA (DoxX/SURF4 family)